MNNKKIFEKIITEKRAKCSNERPKYGLRKLTVGVVSCLLGYMMFMTPNVTLAEKVDQSQAVAKVESTEVNNVENVEEKSEQPKEEADAETSNAETEIAAQSKAQAIEKSSSGAKESAVQSRSAVATETLKKAANETDKSTEFKLTDAQKKQLVDAGFDEEQIQVIVDEIKAELAKDKNFKVDEYLKQVIELKKTGHDIGAETTSLNDGSGIELSDGPGAETNRVGAAGDGNTATRDAAPPEETDTTPKAKNAVHGYVGVQVGDDINKNLAKADNGQFRPIEGVKVYFQWFEKKGNRVSPVYAATSDASGQFHMNIKPYIGEDGKLVKFDADTTSSAGEESYKFWVDESTIPAGYQLQYSTGESVEFTDRGVAGANFDLGKNTLTDFKVLLMEIPKENLMHKTATPTPPQIPKGDGTVRGKVSWDYESAGGIQWGIVATHTSPAPDVTVRASYLSDYALKQIFSQETANMLSLAKPSDIRGSGWTYNLEKQLQDWIKEQVAKEPDKWIAETVSAVTNAEGDYKIQFNGTWGPERNGVNVAKYTAPKGWTQEQKDRVGTVAKNATDGSFVYGALDKNEKHVNSEWLFISTEGTDKLRVMTPWNNNWYTGSNNAWGIHFGWAQAAFGVKTSLLDNNIRADFALAPAEIKFNITNYDTGNNYATPGDGAKTETKGLPYKNTSDSFRIVWYDANGKVVKTEDPAKPTSTGDFPEATLGTSDVTKTTTYTAKLYRVDAKGNNGQLLAQDSFTVKISKLVVSAHDEVNIPNPGANDESMKGATYSAQGLPEGLTMDPNNGTISGKATAPGKYTVTVTTKVPDKDTGEDAIGTSQYKALVTDSPLKDGAVNSAYSETIKPTEVQGYVFKNVSAKFIDGKAIDGLTISGDKISGTPTTKVEATQDDPNVEVTYDIYKLNDKNEEVLIKEGHIDRVPLSIKEDEKAKTDAEKNPAVDPATTEVANKTALTDEEKAKVVEAVKKANPEAKDVTVADDGKATLTYADGTTNEIPGEKTVTEKAKTEVDKKALQDEVDKEKSTRDTDKYKNADQDKKDAYDKALEDAKKVLENKDATQEEVNKAKEDLAKAEEALNGKATQEVDKSALQTEVDKNKDDAITGSDKYKNADQDKKDAYDKALEDAKKVLENKDATQEEVNKAKEDLAKAEEALNGKATQEVDKSALQTEVDKTKTMQ
ncbi:Ig domain protein [Finegoldia magna SY403409CC001050417]|uniref:putative Ig domain-containing protein n=1 Tax=Finegoldia magna TaxID=1260 RepID=UPI00021A3B67|nr:putative Ig domain-containing protein [Finegoldia magna]EGS35005.1 Ig domain protein [Finegoldia magna SY403409CC001050417]